MKSRIVVAASIVVLFLSGLFFYFNENKPAPIKSTYEYKVYPCWFAADHQREITCGYLIVQADLGEFRLPVVILKDDSPLRESDPIIYLNGGPGVSHGLHEKGIERWLSWMRLAGLNRDVILMDGRGIGLSQPTLDCPALKKFNADLLENVVSIQDERKKNRETVNQCLANLAKNHPEIHPQNFGTQQSAQDIIGLMQSLSISRFGYASFHLLGVSYGTRLALETERRMPQDAKIQLKTMVLDSLYPAGKGGVTTIPSIAGEAFDQLFNACSQSSDCKAPFARMTPDADALTPHEIDAYFQKALSRLADTPVSLMLRSGDSAPVSVKVTDSRFLAAVFSSAYRVESWPIAMAAIVDVLEGSRDGLKTLMVSFLTNNASEDFNELAFLLTDCQDNGIGDYTAFSSGLDAYPQYERFFQHEWEQQVCHDMAPSQPLLLGRAPQVKTLVLSGVQDPITPIGWARELQTKWPEAIFVERAHIAHSVLSDDICLLQGLKTFFAEGLLAEACGEED
jgi:pimeloyl-ACP methyl ester carboxylesterase